MLVSGYSPPEPGRRTYIAKAGMWNLSSLHEKVLAECFRGGLPSAGGQNLPRRIVPRLSLDSDHRRTNGSMRRPSHMYKSLRLAVHHLRLFGSTQEQIADQL